MVYGVGVRSALPMNTGDLRGALASTLPDSQPGTRRRRHRRRLFRADATRQPADDLWRVADELHQQYLLGFAPQVRDGKTHKLEVKVKQDGAKVRVRKSYKAPKAG
jgi:hypothetical protein